MWEHFTTTAVRMTKVFKYSFVRIFILKTPPVHQSGVAEHHRLRFPGMDIFYFQ